MNTQFTILTSNNTVNDLRLKVNEHTLMLLGASGTPEHVWFYDLSANNIFATTDVYVANTSVGNHMSNTYSHGVVVKTLGFNANSGILNIAYNDNTSSIIDFQIGKDDNVTFKSLTVVDVTSNSALVNSITSNTASFTSNLTTPNAVIESLTSNSIVGISLISNTASFTSNLTTPNAVIDKVTSNSSVSNFLTSNNIVAFTLSSNNIVTPNAAITKLTSNNIVYTGNTFNINGYFTSYTAPLNDNSTNISTTEFVERRSLQAEDVSLIMSIVLG